jgi:hypothetical protein
MDACESYGAKKRTDGCSQQQNYGMEIARVAVQATTTMAKEGRKWVLMEHFFSFITKT